MKVLIGIQARSTSTRLPNKANEMICGFSLLSRVIYSCSAAADRIKDKGGADCEVVVLTPFGDPIAEQYASKVKIFEGPENDVLSRYMGALEKHNADYLVRITGDCPLLTSSTIIGITLIGLRHNYDYFSNVDERFRTAMDGLDCEVISRRLMKFADEVSTDQGDREHVTTAIRRRPPAWAKIGTAMYHLDNSHIKLSVDTPEDLEAVRRAFDSAYSKYQMAVRLLGKDRVHRI
jgi:spore coat polysaccharide biosynthesis protein SpsF (cytidylyltransferase family)